MIHFVVVSGEPAAVERLAPRLLPAVEATRCFDGEPHLLRGRSGTWAIAIHTAADPMVDPRISVHGDGEAAVLVNGPAHIPGAGPADVTDALLASYLGGGSDAVARTLAGGYNFVGVSPTHGLRAFVDFSGVVPLYWHQGDDVVVLSNRTTTIGALVDPGAWDLRALGWILAAGTLAGEQMPVRAARYLPPGQEVRLDWGARHATVGRSPNWLWPEPSGDAGRDDLTPAEWDDVTSELVASFGALKAFGAPVRLSLSGGKDSRLCLALSKAAGLDGVVSTRTNGTVDSPEVECAAAVAQASGFPHERIGPPPAATGDATPTNETPVQADWWWQRIRQHLYRFESIVSPWDGTTGLVRETTLNIRGIGGEFYRRGNVKAVRQSRFTRIDELVALYADGSDRLGVLRPTETAFQDGWRTSWLEEAARQVRFDLLPEKWYVDHRVGHWNGPLAQNKAGYINVVPLLCPGVARKSLELSVEARSTDRLHFEVMRRAAPELLAVPILGDVWAPAIRAASPIDLPDAPFPTTLAPTREVLARPKWQFLADQSGVIADLLAEAARQRDLGSICNVKKLTRLLRGTDDFGVWKAKEVFSAVGIALSLLGRTEPAVDPLRPNEAS